MIKGLNTDPDTEISRVIDGYSSVSWIVKKHTNKFFKSSKEQLGLENRSEYERKVTAKYYKQKSVAVPIAKTTMKFLEGGEVNISIVSNIENVVGRPLDEKSHMQQAQGEWSID